MHDLFAKKKKKKRPVKHDVTRVQRLIWGGRGRRGTWDGLSPRLGWVNELLSDFRLTSYWLIKFIFWSIWNWRINRSFQRSELSRFILCFYNISRFQSIPFPCQNIHIRCESFSSKLYTFYMFLRILVRRSFLLRGPMSLCKVRLTRDHGQGLIYRFVGPGKIYNFVPQTVHLFLLQCNNII